jgi:enoyl-CoA hydratase/carnithine racemase
MAYEQILYEVADPVATITLNRPESLNAWTPQMGDELADAVLRADRDRAVVGIVVTGAGKGFCSGADLSVLKDLDPDAAEGDATASVTDPQLAGNPDAPDALRRANTFFMSLDKPVIAAINGPVAGMGVPMALSCDVRFMAEDAVITTSFVQRGLIAEWGLSWLLPRLVGPAHALDLLFSSRKVRGAEAERIGLVNRAVPNGEALAIAQRYVADLADTASPTSMAIMKRQVYAQLHDGYGDAHDDAVRLMLESFRRPDFAEGVRSFLERRPPTFARLGDD